MFYWKKRLQSHNEYIHNNTVCINNFMMNIFIFRLRTQHSLSGHNPIYKLQLLVY